MSKRHPLKSVSYKAKKDYYILIVLYFDSIDIYFVHKRDMYNTQERAGEPLVELPLDDAVLSGCVLGLP